MTDRTIANIRVTVIGPEGCGNKMDHRDVLFINLRRQQALMLTMGEDRQELPGMRRGRVLTQQAWQGRVEGGEEPAAGKAALRSCRDCSVSSPRMAGLRRRATVSRGCEPPPAGQEHRHQHRSSRFSPTASASLAGWYSVSVFQSAGLTGAWAGHRQHLAGNLHAGVGGIDLPAWPVAMRGLNSKANQPLTALR